VQTNLRTKNYHVESGIVDEALKCVKGEPSSLTEPISLWVLGLEYYSEGEVFSRTNPALVFSTLIQ
jgi:hypothetical protein